jgi:hypothetical protein
MTPLPGLQLPKDSSTNSATSSTAPPALVRSNTARGTSHDVDHYTLAEQMRNYHAIDIARHCKAPTELAIRTTNANVLEDVCLGANWMHELPTKGEESVDIVEEGQQKRLYSWLLLCDDRKLSFAVRGRPL